MTVSSKASTSVLASDTAQAATKKESTIIFSYLNTPFLV